MAISSRTIERERPIDAMLRAIVPLLWLLLLGFQWSIASIVLDDISQIVAQRLYLDFDTESAPIWGLFCDSYVLINMVSWSLWLAACPRAITAVLSCGANQPWAQRRLTNAVLVVLFIGLTIQGLWLIAILQVHSSVDGMAQHVLREVLVRFEEALPWRWQLVALSPLLAWLTVLVVSRRADWSFLSCIAIVWAATLFLEMNLADAIKQVRMAVDLVHGYTGRVAIVAQFASVAVVVVALLLEYRQVWQSKLAEYSGRCVGKPLAPNPQPPVPSP